MMQNDIAAIGVTEFAWKRSVNAPPTSEGGVVPGIDVAAILHDAANDLITELFNAGDLKSLSKLTVRPVLRAVSALFEAPLPPGTPVYVGATLGSLSGRSFELRTGVWVAESRQLVAHGGATYVVVDTRSRKAVAVPENVVDALRRLEPDLDTSTSQSSNQQSDVASPQT